MLLMYHRYLSDGVEDDCVVDVVVQQIGLMQLQLFLHRLLWLKTVKTVWQVVEGRQSIRPGLRRQAGTIKQEPFGMKLKWLTFTKKR